jgi:serine/threonine-protein kinase
MGDANAGSRVGSQFGPYRLLRLLGRGGMGEVYEAEDTVKDRTVALKLLSDAFSNDPVFRLRLQREARTAGRLNEPHIVPIHDFGEIDGLLYVDMRLIDGVDVASMLSNSGPIVPARAVAIVRQIASALDAAHGAGVMHRDVKPENILVSEQDFAYLVDFGIASATADEKLTQMGTAVGTLKYMAPERFTDTDVTSRVDVYSLACVLYECLTGSAPYRGSQVTLMNAHLYQAIPRPSALRSSIPPALDQVIARGMAKNPGDRYATPGDLAAAAEAALAAPDPDRAPEALRHSQVATMGGFVAAAAPPTNVAPAPPTNLASAAGAPPTNYVPPPLAPPTKKWQGPVWPPAPAPSGPTPAPATVRQPAPPTVRQPAPPTVRPQAPPTLRQPAPPPAWGLGTTPRAAPSWPGQSGALPLPDAAPPSWGQPPPPAPPAPPAKRALWPVIGLVAAVVVLLVVGAVIVVVHPWSSKTTSSTSEPSLPPTAEPSSPYSSPLAPPPPPSDAVRLEVLDDGVLTGSPTAPRTIDVFNEPICPPCGVFIRSFATDVEAAVDNKKLAVRWHLLNFLDEQSVSKNYSTRAVAATYCVAAQNDPQLYTRFYAALFATDFQPAEGGTTDRTDLELAHLAQTLGANADVVNCIKSGDDIETGKTNSVNGYKSLQALQGNHTPYVWDGLRPVDIKDRNWLSALIG